MYAMCGNDLLSAQIRELRARGIPGRSGTWDTLAGVKASNEDHLSMLETLRRRDAEGLAPSSTATSIGGENSPSPCRNSQWDPTVALQRDSAFTKQEQHPSSPVRQIKGSATACTFRKPINRRVHDRSSCWCSFTVRGVIRSRTGMRPPNLPRRTTVWCSARSSPAAFPSRGARKTTSFSVSRGFASICCC